MDVKDLIPEVVQVSCRFLQNHTVDRKRLADGELSLKRHQNSFDLYGVADATYVLHTLGRLTHELEKRERRTWAEKILSCQDEQGWFSKRNLRGHPREHATAYAIGALRLLEVEPDEHYVARVKPLEILQTLLSSKDTFLSWIASLGFRLTPWDIWNKRLGWHYIWRGSHVGAGVPAVVGMTRDLIEQWWPKQIDLEEWFNWYFEWLDTHANAETGYWQRAFWNRVYRKPTFIDMGGAVHFLWIYEVLRRSFPYPEAVIESTLQLQQPNGLYKDHPFCIDFDADFCLVRSYLQLSEEQKPVYRDEVYGSVMRNFEAIVQVLTEQPLTEIYGDSHGLPGALAALLECARLPDFKYAEALADWQHPLDKAWWL